jgi:hypothetical protein
MQAEDMKLKQIIDLSHTLPPDREARRLDIERIDATHITGASGVEQWYIMHRYVIWELRIRQPGLQPDRAISDPQLDSSLLTSGGCTILPEHC